ncbi:MAG: hypothetical protein IKY44_06825, partial [Clostridia bacterium]|nr:hypothetical protein [Clostridia bacterium]
YKVKNIKLSLGGGGSFGGGTTTLENPYYDLTNTSPYSGVKNAAKFYTLEATPTSKTQTYTSTGIWLKKVTKKSDADSPDGTGFTNFFSTNSKSSTSGATQDKLNNFFDKNIDVDVKGIVDAAKNNSQFTKTFENGIELKYNERNDSQRYYAKYDGSKQFFITFATKPADQDPITLAEWKSQAGIDTFEPYYRVTTNSSKSKHDLAYAYTEADGTFKNKTSNQSYTYADHYYKNKWFFIDLQKDDGSLGTLHISNSVTAEKFYDYDKKQFFWISYYKKTADYTITDGYKIPNYANFGNIVMEDCYFFVNGNVEIANGYNMSNCKVFATGYILLESVYYMEGLLSLETKAGSDTIKQSLYYTDSYFQSNLVSRYAMAWLLDNVTNGIFGSWNLLSPTGKDAGSWGSIPEEYNDCAISNACSYTAETPGWFSITYSNGYLATYRYPTVLKAVVIAEGKTDFEDYARKNNDRSTTKTTFKDVSIILNPNGSADGVVDAVLIEGQLFSRYKTLTLNHNYASEGSVQTNRYAAANQIQYHPYGDGSADEVFGELNEIIKTELVSTETKSIVIQNSGVIKK